MGQEKQNLDPVWCRRLINQVIREQTREVGKNGRQKKEGGGSSVSEREFCRQAERGEKVMV